MRTAELSFDTRDRTHVDLTGDVERFCADAHDGLCNVFVPHATAGLCVVELGSGSEDDLAELLERLLPKDERYRHAHGSRGHGADHLLPVLLSPSLTVPVTGGRPELGTWQRIVLVDRNPDNTTRAVRLSFVDA